MAWQHAQEPRGLDIARRHGRSTEGRFGLMFKDLDAFQPGEDLLRQLAAALTEPAGGDLDNANVPAGFTFLGQFIDHDMTLDRTPLDEANEDPDGTTNFRAPRFDLDSMYGKGPSESPQLYEPGNTGKLRFSTPNGFEDLPREADGSAIIGDPRNDENLIVCQLHIAFMKFHNALIAQGRSFEDARRLTRWHFQWIIVHDFLPHVVGQATVDRFLSTTGSGKPQFKRDLYKPKNPNRPMMPLEYSVAAYRFGHSMVRPGYRINAQGGGAIFSDPQSDGDLHGSRPIPVNRKIDWHNFFEVPGVPGPPANNTRRMDTHLANGLFHLPVPQVVPPTPAPPVVSLAERNLLRGTRVGLPDGQAVARKMNVTVLGNQQLGITQQGFNGKAPLWFYILAEAERQQNGTRLGEVGGRIVAEVILGIIDADKGSYFDAPQPFKPMGDGSFRMGDLLKFAGAA